MIRCHSFHQASLIFRRQKRCCSAVLDSTGCPVSGSSFGEIVFFPDVGDLEALQQRFPKAPARGQASTYRGGDIITIESLMAGTTLKIEDERNTADPVDRPVSRHTKQPNLVVRGNEWISQ
jgi:hypothetical protein